MSATIYCGIAGWSYEDWIGTVYPDTREKDFDQLTYASSYFDTIEINTTFYRPPSPYMTKNWVKKTIHNSNFKFTAKLWQKFTHEKTVLSQNDIKIFKDGINPLMENNKLGALLIQYPWSYKYNEVNVDKLQILIGAFKTYPLIVEFRHNSWILREVLTILNDNNVGFCNIDQPVIGQSIKPSSYITSSIGYIRLHGRNYKDWFRKNAGRDDRYNYLYKPDELEMWIDKIKKIREKAKQIYVIANNHYRGQAAVNALQMKSILNDTKVPVPGQLAKIYPVLQEIKTEKNNHASNGKSEVIF
ncbi:MAG: hypothetical protein A2Y62_04500 [Candidatus Fischerbacteria bacterium RBG_13_37_8]|uniref:DUF72 domain-containing protein n=1 Tax=Candidatus Fischerbacteria bacterium RBG_13_37_8 TaxID=1817863 RepID=A0A1F5V4S0_9BACT|nr:MAG: hypothetical protein A2Y62_04500 [Candidatus Fischerbacteria bacterium RBG_13_37_8]